MIIKELELINIRSHGHSLIRFPLGRTLLEGDIGSGKSSVLMAIEFALFGLGSDSGSSVLKLGQESGQVRMVFEVDRAEYEVTRRLQRKAGRVQQLDGELKMPAEILNLSPSELKEKVLEVLEFNEVPDPKAQSWIYRYAVYTPQEEMKSILTLVPEQRLQILRRAFRVEDYKVASTNAEDAAREFRMDAREQDGIARGVDELRGQAEQLLSKKGKLSAELSDMEGAEVQAEDDVRLAKEERESLQKRELILQGIRAEQEYNERIGSDAARDSDELRKEISVQSTELEKLDATVRKMRTGRTSSATSIIQLRKEERSLGAKARKLADLRVAAETKLHDYESVMKNGVCPVCDRPAKPSAFKNKKARKDAERKHFTKELDSVEEQIKKIQRKIEQVEEYKETTRELARLRSERSRLKREIERKEQTKAKFEEREALANITLQRLGGKLKEFEGLILEIEKVDRDLAKAEKGLRSIRDTLVETRGNLENALKRHKEIAVEIAAKEDAARRSRKLKEREIWLEDYFVPTVKAIEKSVLATINQEFDSLFKRWFGMLVTEPDKEVGIDEYFTPMVTQSGYEQDVRYLSGGERTSVALAYRLSLNILAQRVSAGMKSNLLIMDEPTDGFSKDQLGNVREVLDEVGSPQVIIVSHDKELESFADQIFRVGKKGTESVVES